MRLALLILAFLFLSACGSVQREEHPLAAAERAYLDKAMAQPVKFEIPTSEAQDAWGRAQSFVGKYSVMKIQIATDYVLQTYSPTDENFGFNVVRTPGPQKTEILVDYNTGPGVEDPAVGNRDAHLLAFFVKTGEAVPPELVNWCPVVVKIPGGMELCKEQ